MNKKLSLLAAGSVAGLTVLISALNAADATTAAPATTTTTTITTTTTTAPAASTAKPASTATTAAPAASAAATASAATTASAGPKVDLTKLPKPSDKTDLTFDKDIAPILKVSCSGCHIGSARPSGGLDLGSLATALKGGTKGKDKDIVAGHADQSNVVLYTSGAVSTAMPPKPGPTHPALTSDQIALIMAWINQGAK